MDVNRKLLISSELRQTFAMFSTVFLYGDLTLVTTIAGVRPDDMPRLMGSDPTC